MTYSVQLPPPPANHSISRRRFLRFGALAAAAMCIPLPALALERTSQRFERSLDFSAVEAERAKLLSELARRLDQKQISNLMAASVAWSLLM